MFAESQFRHILILTMSNSDGKDLELENSPAPTSIPPNGSPNIGPISITPKSEIQVSVSRSTEEVKKRRRSGDETDENLKNSSIPTSITPAWSPNLASISNTPNMENQVSVSPSTEEELKKRRRLGDETDQKDEELKIPPTPSSIPSVGSLISESISKTSNSENQVYVSLSTKEPTKRRRLGDEIDENDDGFTTPTDSDHRISVPAKCPPAPRKPSSRKGKSSPETATETRRSIFPVDVSDEEAESMFPPRVED